MSSQIVPVNKERHAKVKIKPLAGFQFAAGVHFASVMAHEFSRAASIYPVVFLTDAATGIYRPVVLMGLDEGENLFVKSGGAWQASYVPAVIRRYPFVLARSDVPGSFTVCVDEGSELVNEAEGALLFDEEGKPAVALENVVRYLTELQQMDAQTTAYCEFLAKHDLLVPLNMQLKENSQVKNVLGAFAISDERMARLSDEVFLQMRTRGYLPATYAHRVSLAQVERLLVLKEHAQAQLVKDKSTVPPAPDVPQAPTTVSTARNGAGKKSTRRK